MVEVPSWVILNFFTSFLLILLLIFQNKTSRLQKGKGKKYSAILICTLVLLFSESIGRIGEYYPEKYLFLARIGYYLIFLLDPVDILFAVSYIDCWMDTENNKPRTYFRMAFQIFAIVNIVFVSISSLFKLGWFFYFEDGVYYRGDLYLFRAILLLIFIILLIVYAVVFRDDFMSEYKNMVLCLPILAFSGAMLQIFLYNIDTTYGGISLGCLILFFFFQSNDVNVDYLTGVLNRRGLDIRMEEKIRNSQLTGRDFSAIMMDIDKFKTINDTFGHEEGDRAIKHMAQILMETFGEDVSIGRFGGDEFCVITDNVSRPEIESTIQEVHVRLTAMRDRSGWDMGIDVSSGFEVYDHACGLTPAQFSEKIDTLMYNQKQEHHNKLKRDRQL